VLVLETRSQNEAPAFVRVDEQWHPGEPLVEISSDILHQTAGAEDLSYAIFIGQPDREDIFTMLMGISEEKLQAMTVDCLMMSMLIFSQCILRRHCEE